MSKQPKQTVLSEIERLRHENASLREKLDLARLGLISEKGSVEPVIQAAAQQFKEYRRVIDNQQRYIAELEEQIPFEVIKSDESPIAGGFKIKGANGRWQKTLVGVTLTLRDSDAKYHIFKHLGTYLGESEVALLDLGARVTQMLHSVSIDSVPKIPKGLQIVRDELIKHITILATVVDSEYRSARLEIFNEAIWPRLVDNTDSDVERNEAMSNFNQWADRLRENHRDDHLKYLQRSKTLLPFAKQILDE